ncbi:M20/M25/M40 family metallo-hydrolase [Sphingomonas aliaeris]|uniref:M20/M25/M40 family metallo-hydrolase n=1 Tax=Sphingomonas aliaeris TaxID=2759526 RepID=A0A974NSE1_9SPHN|nr:M20/M25/M40 family metallo-hydrolase [Sphingomonas aliaeris]QQV76053.1 M20/M25/M40 family metallo-hydrolase [Sphingomonas aliaeris]
MRYLPLLAPPLLTLALTQPAVAQDKPDPARLKASVAKLVSFGTRHTLSSPDDPVRGIGAARAWGGAEMARIADACGGCIVVSNIARTMVSPRTPDGANIVDVLGFQQGSDPKRVVIVAAHIDSRASDVMDAKIDAPGANDNASGSALVLEAARLLSKQKFRATIVYALLSGEEQGLLGGQLLAETAKEKNWTVTAMLNNDIVGNSIGQGGVRDVAQVRVFSEGIRASEDLAAQIARRGNGGEDDGPSRALAKAIDGIAGTVPGGLDVFVDRRPDRFGRGGDHEPFLKLGFPAVRFTSSVENWDAQHQNLRTEKGVVFGDTIDRMDFAYLAKVTAINVATIRRLAAAPAAPDKVTISGDLSRDTKVAWAAIPGAVKYRVKWRKSDARDWTGGVDVAATETLLKNVPVDDHLVGVAAVAADGSESIVTFGERARR